VRKNESCHTGPFFVIRLPPSVGNVTVPTSFRPSLLVGLLFLSTGCKESTNSAPTERLTIVSGDYQQSFPSRALPAPIVVKALAQDGSPTGGAPVQFQVAAGGGYLSLSGATTSLLITTDTAGRASAPWVIGAATGDNVHQVVVTRPGLLGSVTFYATGLLGAPYDLAPLQGPDVLGTGPPYAPTMQIAIRDSARSVVTTVPPTVITIQDRTTGFIVRLSGSTATTQNGIASFPNLAVVCSNAGTTTAVSFDVVAGQLSGTVGFRVFGPGCGP
jgi:hypothetical protein